METLLEPDTGTVLPPEGQEAELTQPPPLLTGLIPELMPAALGPSGLPIKYIFLGSSLAARKTFLCLIRLA